MFERAQASEHSLEDLVLAEANAALGIAEAWHRLRETLARTRLAADTAATIPATPAPLVDPLAPALELARATLPDDVLRAWIHTVRTTFAEHGATSPLAPETARTLARVADQQAAMLTGIGSDALAAVWALLSRCLDDVADHR